MKSSNKPQIREGHWECREHDRRMRVIPPASGDAPTATRYECSGSCYWVRLSVEDWRHDGQLDRPGGRFDCSEPNNWVPFPQMALLPLGWERGR